MCSFGVGVYQFSSNLPAPINVSSTEQTKAGNLIIEGVLRLGQFITANAPSEAEGAAEGALYYDTTEKKTKVYISGDWTDLGGGAEPGQLPAYTSTQRDALSPTEGQQIYNTTENKVQVFGQEAWKTVTAKLALAATCSLDGDCDSTHCADEVCCDTACSGTVCQTCGALSSAGLGHCGYVNSSSDDPRNTCTTAAPDAADSCKSPNCSGTGYTCGYLSGEASQPTCKTCIGSSYNPYDIAQGVYDTEGTNLCTATHYRCDGNGNCTSPCSTDTTIYIISAPNRSCSTLCTQKSECGCKSCSCRHGDVTGWVSCTCSYNCITDRLSATCYNWQY